MLERESLPFHNQSHNLDPQGTAASIVSSADSSPDVEGVVEAGGAREGFCGLASRRWMFA